MQAEEAEARPFCVIPVAVVGPQVAAVPEETDGRRGDGGGGVHAHSRIVADSWFHLNWLNRFHIKFITLTKRPLTECVTLVSGVVCTLKHRATYMFSGAFRRGNRRRQCQDNRYFPAVAGDMYHLCWEWHEVAA